MKTLDEFVAAIAENDAKIHACAHVWGKPQPGYSDLGQRCVKCSVYELPWLRRRNAELERVPEDAEQAAREFFAAYGLESRMAHAIPRLAALLRSFRGRG